VRQSPEMHDYAAAQVGADDRAAAAHLIGDVRAQGVSILLTEREPAIAKAVADRVARLERGAVIS